MSYATDRIILFDRNMDPLPEIAPEDILSRVRTEELNGEHTLVITTTRRLQEGWRALTVDGMGKWREWVVTEPDEEHASGNHAIGVYHFVWSLQYDLTFSYSHTHAEIGYGDAPKTAQQVAAAVLQDVPNWTVGPCDAASVESGKGAVFIYESAWSRLSKAVEVMSCEVDAVIEVSNVYGVTARKLCLNAHLGNEDALRRFDWGEDLTSIKRTPDPGPYYCRVVPLGKGESEYAEDDETTFEWPLDITEETGTPENPGPYWIQDNEAAAAFRIRLSDGSYYYPTVAVNYNEDDPELLLAAAQEDLENHTRPGVTYEANVVQLGQAGMDVHGVALGDEVQVVDYGFNPDAGLRIQGRVIKIELDELAPDATTTITIGQLRDNLTNVLNTMSESLNLFEQNTTRVREQLAEMTTARYVKDLLKRINTEIAATGGYTYLVEGEGVITYDRAVSDPLIGTEASEVVQIKGGSIRIANSRNTPFGGIDDWEWKTVFTSGHILSELITAIAVTSGYIGNADSSSYWNIDTGEMVIRTPNDITGAKTEMTKIGTISSANVQELIMLVGLITGSSNTTLYGLKTSERGNVGQSSEYDKSYIMLLPYGSNYSSTSNYGHNAIASSHALNIWACWQESGSNGPSIRMTKVSLDAKIGSGVMRLTNSSAALLSGSTEWGFTTDSTSGNSIIGGLNVSGTLNANGQTNFNSTVNVSSGNVIKIGSIPTGNTSGSQSTVTSTGITLTSKRAESGVYVTDDMYLSRESKMKNLTVDSITLNTSLVGYSAYMRVESLYVSGSNKTRVVPTNNYDERLLYCYETATPMFGDIGSSTTDSEGYAYVSIDDVFAETVRTDFVYYVFLQRRGPGELWIEEKHDNYFVVRGTPNLEFDWELKARQVDHNTTRLETMTNVESQIHVSKDVIHIADVTSAAYDEEVAKTPDDCAAIFESLYNDYVSEIERAYEEELAE